MLWKYCFCLLLISCSLWADVYAEPGENDSLQQLLQKANTDKDKAILLNKIAENYVIVRDSTGLAYAQQALNLAIQHQFTEQEADARYYLGLAYSNTVFDEVRADAHFHHATELYIKLGKPEKLGVTYQNHAMLKRSIQQFDSALYLFEKAKDLYIDLSDSTRLSFVLFNTGITYYDIYNNARALEYYFEALKIAQKGNDKKTISQIYNSIAISFTEEGNMEKAYEYHQAAINMEGELGNPVSQAISLTNLGILYKKNFKMDLAYESYHQALKIFQEQDMVVGQAFVYHNIGAAYLQDQNYEEAISNLHKSIELSYRIDNKKVLVTNFISIAEANYAIEQIQEAAKYANQALELATQLKLNQDLYQAYLIASKIEKKKNNLALALAHYEKYTAYKDSVFNLENKEKVNEIHTKYETEKKEQEIALLNKDKALQSSELRRKTLLQNTLFGAFASLLVLGGFGYRSFKTKQENKRKLLAEQLKLERLEAERLAELDQMKSQFFSNIAHEFRTPLTLILGPAEQIEEDPDPVTVGKNIPLIRRSAHKLLNLINQLLDLSKLEDGKLRLSLQNMDAVAFIRGITYSFESLALEKDIKLAFHTESENLVMGLDPDRSDKIFFNLLSNAFKFTPIGGSVEVEVNKINDAAGGPPLIEIKVKDSGIGIAPENIGQLFNRFFQINENQQAEGGTGIGLALTKELVELHQGEISVSSTKGKGSVFTVRLPLVPDDHPSFIKSGEATESSRQVQPATVIDKLPEVMLNDQQPEILIVEDNPDVRAYLKDCLIGDYKVVEARNGKEGLEIASLNIPDLVISDVMMPEMDGYQFCQALKKNELTNHIPLIMLTAKSSMDHKLEGLEQGADDYLAKPFHRKELLIRMKNLIKNRRKLQQKYSLQVSGSTILAPDNPPSEEDPFINKLRQVLDEHLDQEDFGIDTLCQEVGISRTQLHRKLKALTDLSTSRFIRLHKLQKAVELLKSQQYNISEVSYMTGFSSPSYFSQCFQEELHYAPSELQKKNSV
ncbi:MAG: hybrid sensor histidine kinase/response regulator transcription factor [Candidatus Cyclobacteriaceae bacterium M3_2C_046]